MACAAGVRGDAGRSARLLGAADTAGYRHTPARRALLEPFLNATHSPIDDATWKAAYARGRSTAIENTITRALEEARDEGVRRNDLPG